MVILLKYTQVHAQQPRQTCMSCSLLATYHIPSLAAMADTAGCRVSCPPSRHRRLPAPEPGPARPALLRALHSSLLPRTSHQVHRSCCAGPGLVCSSDSSHSFPGVPWQHGLAAWQLHGSCGHGGGRPAVPGSGGWQRCWQAHAAAGVGLIQLHPEHVRERKQGSIHLQRSSVLDHPA